MGVLQGKFYVIIMFINTLTIFPPVLTLVVCHVHVLISKHSLLFQARSSV